MLLGLAYNEHYRAIIFRREYEQVKGIEDRSRELFSRIGKFNGQDHKWTFGRGKTIELAGVKEDADVEKFQGRAHDLKAFDEITAFTKEQYQFLVAWARTTRRNQRVRVIVTGNPPRFPTGDWVKEYWGPWLQKDHPSPALDGELRWYATIDGEDVALKNGLPFKHGNETIRPQSRTFIRSLIQDNPYLMATGYLSRLMGLPGRLRSQLLLGDFDTENEVPNRAYYNYDPARNDLVAPYVNDRPMYFSLDFNVDPSVMTLWQELVAGEYPMAYAGKDRPLYCFGEIHLSPGIDVKALAMLALLGIDDHGKKPDGCRWPENFRGFINHQNPVTAYGDASGGQRRVESDGQGSAWSHVNSILRENLGRRYVVDVPAANPPVFDSLVSVNEGFFDQVHGTVGMFISPVCTMTKRDLMSVVKKADALEIDKSDKTLTHLSDTVRYIRHRRKPTKLGLKTLRNLDQHLRGNDYAGTPMGRIPNPLGR